jgi:hypothetical protein
MTTYDNTNRGALFKNDRKADDKDRDYAGTLNVGGVEYWVSAWLNTSKKNGAKYLSLSIKPKDEARAAKPTRGTTDDDLIPF